MIFQLKGTVVHLRSHMNPLEYRDEHSWLEKSQTQRLSLTGGLGVQAACLQGKSVFSFQRVFPLWS